MNWSLITELVGHLEPLVSIATKGGPGHGDRGEFAFVDLRVLRGNQFLGCGKRRGTIPGDKSLAEIAANF